MTSLEHLLAELERIDALIRLRVAHARALRGADDPLMGLYVSEREVDELAAEPAGLPRWATAAIEERPAAHVGAGDEPRLLALARRFGLDAFERDAILIALAPELDLRYERLFGYLHDDVSRRRPSVDLILNLLAPSFEAKLAARARFAAGAPLVRGRLVELFEDASRARSPLLAMGVKLDERIVRYLLGGDGLEPPLAACARTIAPRAEAEAMIAAPLDVAVAAVRAEGRLLVQVHGPAGVGKKIWAEALCARLGMRLVIVDGAAVDDAALDGTAALALREATLQDAALCWDGLDGLLADDRRRVRERLIAALAGWPGVAIVTSTAPWEPDADLLRVSLARPGDRARAAMWERALGDVPAPVAAELSIVAGKFALTAGEVGAAAAAARTRARSRGAASVTVDDLYAGCRARATGKLGELARKIEPRRAWTDLVLPAESMRQLRELCERVQHRSRVLDDWGWSGRLAAGRGLCALFAGPSGTGKTMAAEVLAGELGLELYAIDLSSVVSKYIGETEKNLARVFAEAEASHAILFFDEADALFGKRSEVKDAHDRYANVETSYLLQRMEQYDGVAILATNLRRNLDDAFARRLAFTIAFPFPEEAERLRLWHGVWPAATPREPEVDLAFMARQFKLAGGNIKNIALAATFLAASDGGTVAMRHLVRATAREVQKLGRTLTAEELAGYALPT